MPSVTRLGDSCTGHSCFPPRSNNSGSNNVFVNGIPAHRVGDGWDVHCCDDSCHDGVMSSGSSSVFVNGRPVARIGDLVSCGSASGQGSPNVFAGG